MVPPWNTSQNTEMSVGLPVVCVAVVSVTYVSQRIRGFGSTSDLGLGGLFPQNLHS